MDVDLDKALAPFEADHPVACQITRRIAEDHLLASAVHYLVAKQPDYIPTIAPALDVLSRVYEGQGKTLEFALDAVLEYTHVYMRHQVSFLSRGEYSNTDFDEVYRNVYDNEELMLGTYLPGLYLTQLCWPVHYNVLQHYQRDFLEQAGKPERLLEFGVGHGMTLLTAKRAFPEATGLAYDVSRHSLRFAQDLLGASGLDVSSFRFEQADVVKLEAAAGLACDIGTMGEILEHVEQPERSLENFRTLLRDGASAFITTVIDSNAIDHIYQFKSREEIDAMISAGGFRVERSELIKPAELRLSGEPGSDPTQYYWGIARAS